MLKLKIIPMILIVLILIICLNSCADNRVAFGPEAGTYEIMLDEEVWSVIDSQSIYQLWLLREPLDNMSMGILLMIDCYKKADMEGLSVPDFESFIKFYKTFGPVMEMYENEDASVQDLLDISQRDMRGSSATSGKRQQVKTNLTDFDLTTEYIFLESDNYYFAMSYGVETPSYNLVQDTIGDVVKNLKVLK